MRTLSDDVKVVMLRLTAVLVAISVLISAALGAGPAQAQAPAGDSVTGSGTAAFFGAFTIDAHSGPSGENPSGQASFDTEEVLIDGPVSCLRVSGNVARFNVSLGRITAFFEVTDNAGLGIPDTIAASIALGEPTNCAPLTSPARTGAVLSGDIVVVDAPPLPTSKDQCKDGGWRAFTTFRNQGQCVAFVERGPKPKP
jgi:hypothetical protein